MSRQFYVRFLFFLLVNIFLVFNASLAQEDLPVFRIGVLDSERGPIANGARLAVREINEAGGVEGAEGTRFRLELVIQPTFEGDTLEAAIEAINQARVIAVLGPQTTEDILNNLQFLQLELDVPVLTPAIGDTVIASDTTGRLFRIRAAERFQGSALADYITSDLGVQSVITVQLDRNSTAGRVGFSLALSQLENPPQETTILLEEDFGIGEIVNAISANSESFVAVYGPPDLAAELYLQLRAAGWAGRFSYQNVLSDEFREAIPLGLLRGVLGTATWAIGNPNDESMAFLENYVLNYGEVPGEIEAASYDAVHVIAEAIGEPGDLRSNLANIRDIAGVQGTLNLTGLLANETSNTTSVLQLNAFGGADVVARYQGLNRLPEETPEVVQGEPTFTPTPEGVFAIIESAVQNVRTGPSTDYEVLGQLSQGEQVRVIGANLDFSWVVVEFRGQQGWLATFLLDVIGDRNTVPVISPPPTPTPGPATATPTARPIPDIVIQSASPTTITLGVATNVNVTVRNNGTVAAGPFAVAATFPPDGTFTAVNLPGLGALSEVVVQLPVTLSGGTGAFDVTIVADLNNEVNEGEAGEQNNDDFLFEYVIDRQLILINSTTLNVNSSLDLEGNVSPVFDIQYTGAGLVTSSDCTGSAYCIGLLSPALNWDTVTYGAITTNNGINNTFVANAGLAQGAVLGLFTGEGRRAVLRVDAINPGVSVTLTYKVYQ